MEERSNASKQYANILACMLSITLALLLAYVDYITSDYSLVLFYILLVTATTWYTNLVIGVFIATLCAIVEAVSDYFVHHDAVFNSLHYWNWTCNFLLYCALSFIIYYVRLKHNNE